MRILLTQALIFGCIFYCNAQPSIKIHGLNFHQATGEEIMELDGLIYVTGMAMDTSIRPTERNLHMTSFDLNGAPIKTYYWDNPYVEEDEISMNWPGFSTYENQFIIAYDALQYQCTIRIDTTLSEGSLVGCHLEQEPRLVTYNSQVWDDDRLVVLHGDADWRLYLNTMDLSDPDDFVFHDITPNADYFYRLKSALDLSDGTLALFGTYFSWDGPQEDHVWGLFRLVVDREYSTLSFERFAEDIRANVAFSDWIIDSDGYYVTTGTRYDKAYYAENERLIQHPVILKIDPLSLDIVWEAALAGEEDLRYNKFFNTVIETHDNDGYIAVGAGVTPETDRNGPMKMIYGKVSKEDGEILWYNEIFDQAEDNLSGIFAMDVIATSDGYYMACGNRNDVSPDDGHDSRVQMFLAKFDEEGNLLNTSTVDDQTNDRSVSIFPNPTDGVIKVSMAREAAYSLILSDMQGQLLMQHEGCLGDYKMDISTLSSGHFILLVSDNSGNLIRKEKIILNR